MNTQVKLCGTVMIKPEKGQKVKSTAKNSLWGNDVIYEVSHTYEDSRGRLAVAAIHPEIEMLVKLLEWEVIDD